MRQSSGRRVNDNGPLRGASTAGLNQSTQDERRATLTARAAHHAANGNTGMAGALTRAAGFLRKSK